MYSLTRTHHYFQDLVTNWEACWPHGVRSSPDQAVWVRALAADIVLCCWARHFTLTVPLSIQVYKWVPADLMLGVTLGWTSISPRGGGRGEGGGGGVEILSVASC